MVPLPPMIVDADLFINFICTNIKMKSTYVTYSTHFITMLNSFEFALEKLRGSSYQSLLVGVTKQHLEESVKQVRLFRARCQNKAVRTKPLIESNLPTIEDMVKIRLLIGEISSRMAVSDFIR